MRKTLKLLAWSSIALVVLTLINIACQIDNVIRLFKYDILKNWNWVNFSLIVLSLSIVILFIIIAKFIKGIGSETDEKLIQKKYEKLINYFCIYVIINTISLLISIIPFIFRLIKGNLL
ncbi:hypothetical protein [Oceanirhabdus seepicola]|uniref:Uncharacterized protein n=1 Tax=Oceanirhabdus seepicola TaxID=2828781 RepID=A0A9J6NVS9_9CLOT|nr:hypothetical protein [Oceanirhabdus seepicola]MCM1988586.1 hypothetical protein [Oceanirhabdus seepicola]